MIPFGGFGAEADIAQLIASTARPAAMTPGTHDNTVAVMCFFFYGFVKVPGAKTVFGIEEAANDEGGAGI